MKKIAVFASGSGSNYEALMSYLQDHDLSQSENSQTEKVQQEQAVEIALLVCDKPEAYVIERAQKWATPTFVVSPKNFSTKEEYEATILDELHKHGVEFIVLAGYMRLLGTTLLRAYMGRIINIHPSLLPAFPGKDAIGQALTYGVRVSGITIHFVDEGMDTGPIIYQQALEIESEDTQEVLAQRIQKLEHDAYPRVILACLHNQIVLEGRKVRWVQK